LRARLLVVSVVLAAVLAPVALAGSRGVARSERSAAEACGPWHVRTLLTGQGWLESLAFDGRGGLLLSALLQNKILRLNRHGRLTSVLAGVHAPGGEIVRGRHLYFTTGDTVPPASDGTIDRLDLRTGRNTIWARGLSMPNGLAFLPNGDAVVSRDLEGVVPPTDITLVPARSRHPHVNWARVPDSNGLAVDPTGRWLYSDRTASMRGAVVRVLIAHPSTVQVIGWLGAGSVPDDMSNGPGGTLYIAGFGNGRVFRFDPARHVACTLAAGLAEPTAVVAGGKGWRSGDLFVTSAAGDLYELSRG
jgi:sugar lactone lactonase YvrE